MSTIATTRRRTLAVAAACASTLAACGAAKPARDSAGAIDKAGQTGLLTLHVGDCASNLRTSIDNPDRGHNGVLRVKAVPCTQIHDGQVLRISTIGGGGWPGYQIVEGEAARSRPDLEQQLLAAKVSGGVSLYTFAPTKERWNFENQHSVVYLALLGRPQRGTVR